MLGWKDLVHWDHLDRHVISPGPVDFLRLTTLPAPPRTVKPRKWTYMDQNCLICFILSPTERAYSSYSTLQDAPGKPYPECAAGEEPPGHFGESTLECLECTFESLGFAGISWTILKDNNMIWFYVNLNVYIAQTKPSPLKHWGYTNNENITQVLPTESYFPPWNFMVQWCQVRYAARHRLRASSNSYRAKVRIKIWAGGGQGWPDSQAIFSLVTWRSNVGWYWSNMIAGLNWTSEKWQWRFWGLEIDDYVQFFGTLTNPPCHGWFFWRRQRSWSGPSHCACLQVSWAVTFSIFIPRQQQQAKQQGIPW